ncbi:hypothetical protein OKE80_03135 [Riemerella anatipestifer]|uniref:Uncharacterized protein n=1 Tax=Riemerella anatipestifer TaxID=34085 RepID=A0AAP3EVX3_RIEAN|nr:hypothetical protein [Riemerella anatipestifer]MCO7318376.1 hypothetical protein [Riemerella anatipestifer]MCQ4154650.1 hypothetical protein [Riemerella anatipestifer]MCQ4180638.1 hypothetical protein [Riemerella anatipestifer]MCU7568955.1 hypothetical protein [Riemerella anatipestifer]MCW0473819.1 hypothetical protein [Riemerella anatipestifer]
MKKIKKKRFISEDEDDIKMFLKGHGTLKYQKILANTFKKKLFSYKEHRSLFFMDKHFPYPEV